jgi:hypothetical protein
MLAVNDGDRIALAQGRISGISERLGVSIRSGLLFTAGPLDQHS